jgi:hypothetical protein
MSKYRRKINTKDGTVDVYDVIDAYDVRCPARQHAIKKMLCAGTRGVKGSVQDLEEAIQALHRAVELEQQRMADYVMDEDSTVKESVTVQPPLRPCRFCGKAPVMICSKGGSINFQRCDCAVDPQDPSSIWVMDRDAWNKRQEEEDSVVKESLPTDQQAGEEHLETCAVCGGPPQLLQNDAGNHVAMCGHWEKREYAREPMSYVAVHADSREEVIAKWNEEQQEIKRKAP